MAIQGLDSKKIAKLETQLRSFNLSAAAELQKLGLTPIELASVSADVQAGKSLLSTLQAMPKFNQLLLSADQPAEKPADKPTKKPTNKPATTTVNADPSTKATVALGPKDLVKQSDGSYLVATANKYDAVLEKLKEQQGGFLQGVHVKPNGDGTSTIRLGVTSISSLGKGELFIGAMM